MVVVVVMVARTARPQRRDAVTPRRRDAATPRRRVRPHRADPIHDSHAHAAIARAAHARQNAQDAARQTRARGARAEGHRDPQKRALPSRPPHLRRRHQRSARPRTRAPPRPGPRSHGRAAHPPSRRAHAWAHRATPSVRAQETLWRAVPATELGATVRGRELARVLLQQERLVRSSRGAPRSPILPGGRADVGACRARAASARAARMPAACLRSRHTTRSGPTTS